MRRLSAFGLVGLTALFGPARALESNSAESLADLGIQPTGACRPLTVQDRSSDAAVPIGCIDRSTRRFVLPFTARGAGAVGRSVDRVLRDAAPSIMDFGAAGTGADNDRGALGLAVDAAAAQPNQGMTVLPAGTYRMESGTAAAPRGFTVGRPGTTILAMPGAKFTNSAGHAGSGDFAVGSNLIGFNEGADNDTWYFGRRRTGVLAKGTGTFNAAFSPASFMFDTRSDNVDASTNVFNNGAVFRHIFGGPGTKGGRQGVFVGLNHTDGPTSNGDFQAAYAAVQASSITTTGDNGRAGRELGSWYGAGLAVYAPNGAQFPFDLTAVELNDFTGDNVKPLLSRTVSVATVPGSRGTALDAAISVSAQAGSSGYGRPSGSPLGRAFGLVFTNANSESPLVGDSTIIGSKWFVRPGGDWTADPRPDWSEDTGRRQAVRRGLDFQGFKFSDAMIRGPNSAIWDTATGPTPGSFSIKQNSQTLLTLFGHAGAAPSSTLSLIGQPGPLPPYWTSPGDFTVRVSGGGTLDVNFPVSKTAGNGTIQPPAGAIGFLEIKNGGQVVKVPYYPR